MGRCTSEGNMQRLREKGKQIIVQSISLTMTVEGTMEGDTAKGKWEYKLQKVVGWGINNTYYLKEKV